MLLRQVMATTFLPYQPDQGLLLSASLAEWLPEGHLAYFVGDAIEAMNLEAFYGKYEGDGRRRQPFEVRMMVKVLVSAYASGVFSSRKIAGRLQEHEARLKSQIAELLKKAEIVSRDVV